MVTGTYYNYQETKQIHLYPHEVEAFQHGMDIRQSLMIADFLLQCCSCNYCSGHVCKVFKHRHGMNCQTESLKEMRHLAMQCCKHTENIFIEESLGIKSRKCKCRCKFSSTTSASFLLAYLQPVEEQTNACELFLTKCFKEMWSHGMLQLQDMHKLDAL